MLRRHVAHGQPLTAKRALKMCILPRISLVKHMPLPHKNKLEIVAKEKLCSICFKNNHTSENCFKLQNRTVASATKRASYNIVLGTSWRSSNSKIDSHNNAIWGRSALENSQGLYMRPAHKGTFPSATQIELAVLEKNKSVQATHTFILNLPTKKSQKEKFWPTIVSIPTKIFQKWIFWLARTTSGKLWVDKRWSAAVAFRAVDSKFGWLLIGPTNTTKVNKNSQAVVAMMI